MLLNLHLFIYEVCIRLVLERLKIFLKQLFNDRLRSKEDSAFGRKILPQRSQSFFTEGTVLIAFSNYLTTEQGSTFRADRFSKPVCSLKEIEGIEISLGLERWSCLNLFLNYLIFFYVISVFCEQYLIAFGRKALPQGSVRNFPEGIEISLETEQQSLSKPNYDFWSIFLNRLLVFINI